MIRLLHIIAMGLLGLFTVSCLAGDGSEYLPGGSKFKKDAAYGQALCKSGDFICKKTRILDKWRYHFEDHHDLEIAQRLNRTNVPLMYRPWYITPHDIAKINYLTLSPLPQHKETHGKKLLFVDLGKFAYGAYDENGDLVKWGPETAGEKICDDNGKSCLTVTGDYTVYRKGGSKCYSRTYPRDTDGGASMPYCMFYYRGYAIHGSSLSGFINRSKGCIRIFDEDAKWLSKHFVKLGTEVIVIK